MVVVCLAGAAETTSLIHPDQISACLKMPIASGVEVDVETNPYYLRGDFDGDGKPDYAVAVRGKKTRRLGVLVCDLRRSGVPARRRQRDKSAFFGYAQGLLLRT